VSHWRTPGLDDSPTVAAAALYATFAPVESGNIVIKQ
jgi:hypothetical protein